MVAGRQSPHSLVRRLRVTHGRDLAPVHSAMTAAIVETTVSNPKMALTGASANVPAFAFLRAGH